MELSVYGTYEGMLDTSDNVEEDSSELSSAGAADTAESSLSSASIIVVVK